MAKIALLWTSTWIRVSHPLAFLGGDFRDEIIVMSRNNMISPNRNGFNVAVSFTYVSDPKIILLRAHALYFQTFWRMYRRISMWMPHSSFVYGHDWRGAGLNEGCGDQSVNCLVSGVSPKLVHDVSVLYAYWLDIGQRPCELLPVGQVVMFHVQDMLTVDAVPCPLRCPPRHHPLFRHPQNLALRHPLQRQLFLHLAQLYLHPSSLLNQ